MKNQIEKNFRSYVPKDETVKDAHYHVRNECKVLANELDSVCPNSREKSLAMTKLEEVMFWANAAIDRNQ